MPAPYSNDFRQKVIDAHTDQEGGWACQGFVDTKFSICSRDQFSSNSIGDLHPSVECSCLRLYQTSIHSKITLSVTARDPMLRSKLNSSFNVAKNASTTALSQQSPVLLMLDTTFMLSSLAVYAPLVY